MDITLAENIGVSDRDIDLLGDNNTLLDRN